MKKKILMIGSIDNLPGVPVDFRDYYDFFTSPAGGNWRSDEIDILMNPTRRSLFRKLDEIEEANYDYVITIFSGHGIEVDGETVLGINGKGDEIVLDDLKGLSEKQLSIIDCCRSSYTRLPVELASFFDETTMLSMSRDPIRQAYEECIAGAMPQEMILFACAEGEAAKDTIDENIQSYSQYLLDATQEILADTRSPFISVNSVHRWAAALMRQNPLIQQRPQMQRSRRPARRRLPWAVNAKFLSCDS